MSASTHHSISFDQIDTRASDLVIVFASAVILFFVRLVLGETVLKRAAEKLQLNPKKTRKFKEYAWFTLYYPAVFGFACYMCYKSGVNWVWGDYSDNLFANFPQWSDDTEFAWIRPYYLIQLGFYVQALFCLLFIDTKLSDFYELLLHHCVTIALIALSLASRFHRCGITVFILHDCADILLYSAKAGHEIHKSISSVLFPLFVVAFAYTRMYKFPNAWYDMLTSPDTFAFGFKRFYSRDSFSLSPFDGSVGLCIGTACSSYYFILILMLGMLILLNSYWFSLILRMVVRMTLLKKNEGDIRDKDHQKGQ